MFAGRRGAHENERLEVARPDAFCDARKRVDRDLRVAADDAQECFAASLMDDVFEGKPQRIEGDDVDSGKPTGRHEQRPVLGRILRILN
jgi:hypothetical protein